MNMAKKGSQQSGHMMSAATEKNFRALKIIMALLKTVYLSTKS